MIFQFGNYNWNLEGNCFNLFQRHWTIIEELIERKIVDDDTITIKDFEEVGVFQEDIAKRLFEVN